MASADDRERDENRIRIPLDGKIYLRDARRILHVLDDAMNKFAHIEIDMSAVIEVDLCALQLLLSARKSATALGRQLTIIIPPNGAVEAALVRVGLLDRDGRARNQSEEFWRDAKRIAVKAA